MLYLTQFGLFRKVLLTTHLQNFVYFITNFKSIFFFSGKIHAIQRVLQNMLLILICARYVALEIAPYFTILLSLIGKKFKILVDILV